MSVIADSTAKLYNTMLSKFNKECGEIENTDKVSAYLSSLKLPSRKIMLVAIIRMLKAEEYPQDLINHYGILSQESRISDKIERTYRSPTAQEASNYISWESIIKIRDRLGDYKNDRDHMKYVILCLFTLIPPQRGQIYYNCYIDKEVEGSNTIDLNRKKLIATNYKTIRLYGKKEFDLPSDLVEVVKTWKPKCDKYKGRLLFTQKGKPLDQSSFSHYMYSVFGGIKVSTDMLRKIYISKRAKEGMTERERTQLAEAMSHSVEMQEFNYNKF